MSKINNLTPNVQINQQASTTVRTTVDSSSDAKLRDGLNATANTTDWWERGRSRQPAALLFDKGGVYVGRR